MAQLRRDTQRRGRGPRHRVRPLRHPLCRPAHPPSLWMLVQPGQVHLNTDRRAHRHQPQRYRVRPRGVAALASTTGPAVRAACWPGHGSRWPWPPRARRWPPGSADLVSALQIVQPALRPAAAEAAVTALVAVIGDRCRFRNRAADPPTRARQLAEVSLPLRGDGLAEPSVRPGRPGRPGWRSAGRRRGPKRSMMR